MFSDYQSSVFLPSAMAQQTGLYPNWVGRLAAKANYHCHSRVLDDYFLIYVSKGAGYLRSADENHVLSTGDIFFLFPGIMHSYRTSKRKLLELSWIGFNGFLSNIIVRKLGIHPTSPILKSNRSESRGFQNAVDQLVQRGEETGEFARTGLLYQVIDFLMDSGVGSGFSEISENQQEKAGTIERALAYIDRNFTGELSISELAEYVNLSRTALSKKFKKETGLSPQQYLSDVRLIQAEHLLSSRMAIRDVAHLSGFRDEYYFSRCFKNKYGIPPGKFRKERNESPIVSSEKAWL